MKTNKHIQWITRTALFLALLIAAQVVLRGFGQYVLGTVVNLILIITVMITGLSEGITIAVLSPVMVSILGFGPALPQIVPCVIIGNTVLVLIWYLLAARTEKKTIISRLVALVTAAVAKALVLWLGVVKVVVPILELPAAQAKMLAATFSYPQLITAAAGGTAAVVILPMLMKLKRKDTDNKSEE